MQAERQAGCAAEATQPGCKVFSGLYTSVGKYRFLVIHQPLVKEKCNQRSDVSYFGKTAQGFRRSRVGYGIGAFSVINEGAIITTSSSVKTL